MILYAITLKNMGRDANGLPNYIWATESQVETIAKMRNNPETRYNLIEIGNFIFSTMDVSHIEKKDTSFYGGPIPSYAKLRYKEDETKKLNQNSQHLL